MNPSSFSKFLVAKRRSYRWSDDEGGMSHVCVSQVPDRSQGSHPPFPFSPSALVLLVTSLLLLLSLSSCHHPHPTPSLPPIASCHIFAFFPPSCLFVSSASAINLFSIHLAAVEEFVSHWFAATQTYRQQRRLNASLSSFTISLFCVHPVI